ncbi:putative receptor-like protein kinase [Capsicum annuum]|nr:putative receptor-like protein kinase [Capsicum annuum]
MSNNFFTADIRNTDVNTCKDICLRNYSCKAALFHNGLSSSTGDCYLPSEIFSLANNEKDKTRKKIIQDVAKRLAYLHEECRQKILHLDTKPPNIILDNKLNAKLSDFGLAKLVDLNQSQVITMMRNTPDYLDLEWLSGVITEKVDVSSFGIVILKILSGRRHFEASETEEDRIMLNLFRKTQRKGSWKKIIQDGAKGLAYLHEECRQNILYLDIKPPNILLDEKFNAKLSDFRLAKLIDRNQSQVMTMMRDTPDYLAPEWLSGVITEKVDVYSFDIVILKILSGQRHFEASETEEERIMLNLFRKKAKEG